MQALRIKQLSAYADRINIKYALARLTWLPCTHTHARTRAHTRTLYEMCSVCAHLYATLFLDFLMLFALTSVTLLPRILLLPFLTLSYPPPLSLSALSLARSLNLSQPRWPRGGAMC